MLTLNPGWFLIPLSQNKLLLYSLEGKGYLVKKNIHIHRFLFSRIIEGIKVERLKKEIVGTLKQSDQKQAEDILKDYQKKKIIGEDFLDKGISRDHYLGRFKLQLKFFKDFETSFLDSSTYQDNLKKSRIAVIGLGGQGSWAAYGLACSGIGNLILVDGDIVEEHNLNRQILYSASDIGEPKAKVAKRRLQEFNPFIEIEAICKKLKAVKEVEKIVLKSDFVILTADDPLVILRRIVNSACLKYGIPHIGVSPQGIGPICIPFQTACFGCEEEILRRRFPYYDKVVDYLKKVHYQPDRPSFFFRPAISGLIIAAESAKFISGILPPAILHHRIKIDLDYNLTKVLVRRQLNCSQCFGNNKSKVRFEGSLFSKSKNNNKKKPSLEKKKICRVTQEGIGEIKLLKSSSLPFLFKTFYAKVEDRSLNKRIFVGSTVLKGEEKLAEMKVLGEAIERYSAFKWADFPVITSTKSQLSTYGSFLLEPYMGRDLRNISSEIARTELDWVEGKELSSWKKVFIPANLVFLGYPSCLGKEILVKTHSTGLAAEKSLKKAIINGILETIERDACIRTWFGEVVPLQVNLADCFEPNLAKIATILEENRLFFKTFIVPSKIQIPIGITCVGSEDTPPYISFGSAAGFDFEYVVKKSIYEALMLRDTANRIIRKNKDQSGIPTSPTQINTLKDRLLWYSYYQEKRAINAFIDACEPISFQKAKLAGKALPSTLNDRLSFLADKIKDSYNSRIFFVDITPNEVLRLGFKVVRVLVPNLYLLNLSYNERGKYFPWRFLRKNPAPHPFC